MNGISIFMYHQVGHFESMATHRAVYCDVNRFRAQMRYLKLIGATVLSMSEASDLLRFGAPIPPRAAVLTFDDGCENFYEHALPVLQDFGYPAIVYAIAGLAGGRGEWLAADGLPVPELMSYARLRQIADLGIEIGSHSRHHLRLGELPAAQATAELRDSKRQLEEVLGRAVPHVCYPYGSHTLDTVLAAAEVGYTSGVTCQRAAATAAFDPLALPRKAISFGDNVVGFAWKLHAKNAPKGTAIKRTAFA